MACDDDEDWGSLAPVETSRTPPPQEGKPRSNRKRSSSPAVQGTSGVRLTPGAPRLLRRRPILGGDRSTSAPSASRRSCAKHQLPSRAPTKHPTRAPSDRTLPDRHRRPSWQPVRSSRFMGHVRDRVCRQGSRCSKPSTRRDRTQAPEARQFVPINTRPISILVMAACFASCYRLSSCFAIAGWRCALREIE